MKNKSLFLVALAVVLLAGGFFSGIVHAGINTSIVANLQNPQYFSARTSVQTGTNASGLRAQIRNTNTNATSPWAERTGSNLQGHATYALT